MLAKLDIALSICLLVQQADGTLNGKSMQSANVDNSEVGKASLNQMEFNGLRLVSKYTHIFNKIWVGCL